MKKILLIEDDLTYINLLNDHLSSNGYDVIKAHNGKEGLSLAKKEHPDLILLDVRMPVMDGLTMLGELRKDVYGKSARVILLTNLEPSDTMIKDIIAHKPSFYLVKSDISLIDLLEKIEELLSGKKS